MKTTARLLNIVIRVSGGGALALGLAFWLRVCPVLDRAADRVWRRADLSLWVLAGIAWKNGVVVGLSRLRLPGASSTGYSASRRARSCQAHLTGSLRISPI